MRSLIYHRYLFSRFIFFLPKGLASTSQKAISRRIFSHHHFHWPHSPVDYRRLKTTPDPPTTLFTLVPRRSSLDQKVAAQFVRFTVQQPQYSRCNRSLIVRFVGAGLENDNNNCTIYTPRAAIVVTLHSSYLRDNNMIPVNIRSSNAPGCFLSL